MVIFQFRVKSCIHLIIDIISYFSFKDAIKIVKSNIVKLPFSVFEARFWDLAFFALASLITCLAWAFSRSCFATSSLKKHTILSCTLYKQYIHTYSTYIIHFSSLPLGFFSGRLHQVPKLHISQSTFTIFLIIFLTINPYRPCQLSLWEKITRENPQLSEECWQTLPMCDQMFVTGIWPECWEDVA